MLGAHAATLSATRTNAQRFGLGDEIGTIEEGKRADVLVVDGQPLDDINVLLDPRDVQLAMRDG